jgi:predicted esterase
MIKNIATIVLTASFSFAAGAENLVVKQLGEFYRVGANSERGFHHPFLLYVPAERSRTKTLLVAPNNTGGSLTDLETQVQETLRRGFADSYLAERTKSILLVPIFPRPNVEPPVYTHALSRSALSVKEGPLKRLDLQLIAMVEAARSFLKSKHDIDLTQKIFLTGFSASASFASRFSFLHPEIVAAVAVGAPGGWPIAPVSKFKETTLSYPVGISDVKELTGKEIDLKSLRKVSFFFFIGDRDENDSVTFRDSFSELDEQIVMRLFGKKPIERWPHANELYRDSGLQASFKTYPGIPHEVTRDMREDVIKFFNSVVVKR